MHETGAMPPLENAQTVGLAHLRLHGFLATLACCCLIRLRTLFFFLMQTIAVAEAPSELLPMELGTARPVLFNTQLKWSSAMAMSALPSSLHVATPG